jgi:sec-independent protein translocase protein TatC
VDNTFGQYKNMVLAMVVVFQLPTLVLFLARMRIVTARFLWTKIRYAVLLAFIAGAVLTPSPDPWNQTMLAVPMLALYIFSIGLAWMVAPRAKRNSVGDTLRVVFAAAAVDYIWRKRQI